MRVVLDTNVLVSACWKPGGLEARVVRMALEGTLAACVTLEMEDEYADVLMRPKLSAVREQALAMLQQLKAFALRIESTKPVSVSADEDDNRFLECAESAQADYLITGNLRHYPGAWGCTQIVNARAFLEALGLPEPLH